VIQIKNNRVGIDLQHNFIKSRLSENCRNFVSAMFSNLFVSVADIIPASPRNSEFPKSLRDKRRNLTNFLEEELTEKHAVPLWAYARKPYIFFLSFQRSCFFRLESESYYVASRGIKHSHLSIRWYSNKKGVSILCCTYCLPVLFHWSLSLLRDISIKGAISL